MAEAHLARPLCIVEDCCRPVFSRRWCTKHYQSFWTYGDPLAAGKRQRSCVVCGKEFQGMRKTKVCSSICRGRLNGNKPRDEIYATAKVRQTYTCKGCGIDFRPKRGDRLQYCTRGCSQKHAKSGKIRKKPLLCKVSFPSCLSCGLLFTSKGGMRKCCSPACSKAHQAVQMVLTCAQQKGAEPLACKECGAAFVPAYGDKRRLFCSERCSHRLSRRIKKPMDRARKRAATIERVDPLKVFERDGWRCQICHKATPKRLRGKMVDLAPELDHIIPLSRGGEHSYRNTQCACRKCNGAKSDSIYGQLPMFAA